MEAEKRLIDANALLDRLIRIERGCLDIDGDFARGVRECQHAVISAITEDTKQEKIRITQAIRACQNCGHLVVFDFRDFTPENNKE